MRKVIADPEEIVLVEHSDRILDGRDPYSVGTLSLHDIQGSGSFKREFAKLDSKTQLYIISKIVKHRF